jgi:hypothetical protein
MGLPGDLVAPCASCMLPPQAAQVGFEFPSLDKPGLPNFVLCSLLSTFAGISFVLDFIPPTPQKVADLKPPSIAIFIQPFMASLGGLPASYPPVALTLGGVTVEIPGVGAGPFTGRDISAEMKLAIVCIALPFLLIKAVVEGLLNLQLVLPTLDGIIDLFMSLCLSAGLGTLVGGVMVLPIGLVKFAGCLAQAIMSLFSALI